MTSDSENENKERDSSHHRTSTIALIVASKKRRFVGTPKKSIALLREPNLFASIGNLVDPYTNKPQQMVILGSAPRKATGSTSRVKTRPPQRLIGSTSAQAPHLYMDPEMHTPRVPIYDEPMRETPHQPLSFPSRLEQQASEPLIPQLHRNDETDDEDSYHSIFQRKQLKVYHKVPKRKHPPPESIRPPVSILKSSPAQAVMDLAIDMITEFELLMTQIGVGPICVPPETKAHKATTGASKGSRGATKREPPPPPTPLEDNGTDLDTVDESDGSTVPETNRYFPIQALRQPSHLSYTTILSGEVEVEMEASFDNSYEYVDDCTCEERSDTESYDDEDDDDDSTTGRSDSVVTSQPFWPSHNIIDFFVVPLSLHHLFAKSCYGSAQSEYANDKARCSQQGNSSLSASHDCHTNGVNRATMSIHSNNNKDHSVSMTFGNHGGVTNRPLESQNESCSVSLARETEKPWGWSVLEPLVTHFFSCSSNLDDSRPSTSPSLRLADGDSSSPLGTCTVQQPCQESFHQNCSRGEATEQFIPSHSGTTNHMDALLPEVIVPSEAAPCSGSMTLTHDQNPKVRLPQWEKLLAALSVDSMDDPAQRKVTFSPLVTSHYSYPQEKTQSNVPSLPRQVAPTPKPVQPRNRVRVWPRRKGVF
jgi:hypothetical protein